MVDQYYEGSAYVEKALSIGTEVKIIDGFFVNWIGLKAKTTAIVSNNPLIYKLDIGGHWSHNCLEKI